MNKMPGDEIKKIVGTKKNIFLVLFSPILALFVNPIRLIQSLHNCNVLLTNNWKNYISFDAYSSALKLFYIRQMNNLERHGFYGNSDTIGAGLSMRTFWYQSIASLKIFKELGVVGVLAAMLLWWLSHSIWLLEKEIYCWNFFIVSILAVISSNYLGNLFCKQNYNCYAWAFFPLAIFSLFNNYLLAATISILIISFLSITVFVASIIISLAFFIVSFDYHYLIPVIPGGIKWSYDLLKIGINSDGRGVDYLLQFVGFNRKKSFYKRKFKVLLPMSIASTMVLFPISIYLSDIETIPFKNTQIIVLSVVPIIWNILNQSHILRFVDVQSIFMANLSVTTAIAILSNSPLVWLAFWVVNSNSVVNIILFSYVSPWNRLIKMVPSVKPYNFLNLTEKIDKFISNVKPEESIYVAYSDPGNSYECMFDGYMILGEILIYCADKNRIKVIPDCYSPIFKQSDKYWGRSSDAIKESMLHFRATYSVVYIESNELIYNLEYWQSNPNLQIVNIFKWSCLDIDFKKSGLMNRGLKYWVLLKTN